MYIVTKLFNEYLMHFIFLSFLNIVTQQTMNIYYVINLINIY